MESELKKTTCPRRMMEWGSWEKAENLDYWRDNQTCSFCGSLEPDLLLNRLALDGNVELEPTDKNYKIYVNTPEGYFGKFYFQHFNEAQQEIFIELYNTTPRSFKIAYPGYFYVMPFFTRRKEVPNE